MLLKKQGPDGLYYVRSRYQPARYTATPLALERIAAYRERAPFEELLTLRDGPFHAGPLIEIARFERDGRAWVRFTHDRSEVCIDVEVTPSGKMGEVVAVPPEEAWRIAHERDATRGAPVIDEGEPGSGG